MLFELSRKSHARVQMLVHKDHMSKKAVVFFGSATSIAHNKVKSHKTAIYALVLMLQ